MFVYVAPTPPRPQQRTDSPKAPYSRRAEPTTPRVFQESCGCAPPRRARHRDGARRSPRASEEPHAALCACTRPARSEHAALTVHALHGSPCRRTTAPARSGIRHRRSAAARAQGPTPVASQRCCPPSQGLVLAKTDLGGAHASNAVMMARQLGYSTQAGAYAGVAPTHR